MDRQSVAARAMIPLTTLTAIHVRLMRELAPPSSAYLPLRVGAAAVGQLTHDRVSRLVAFPDVFELRDGGVAFVPALASSETRSAALARVTRVLAAEGRLTAWRNELYLVRPAFGTAPWFAIERAAA